MPTDSPLDSASTVLLIDWPSRDVPESLARAGLTVVSHDGPRADMYNAYEVDGAEVVARHVGSPPDRAEIVYTHRPLEELPEIVATAKQVGAQTVWCQTGSTRAREIVESAGLRYVDEPVIDAARTRMPR